MDRNLYGGNYVSVYYEICMGDISQNDGFFIKLYYFVEISTAMAALRNCQAIFHQNVIPITKQQKIK